MAYYFATAIAIFIFALGLEATALNEQNGNMRDGRFLTKREASPYPLDSTDIQSLKKILAFVEAAVDQDAYAQQIRHTQAAVGQDAYAQQIRNTQQINTQQVLASTNKGYMQGPRRYDETMNENRGMQQAESKFYDALQAIVASKRPGSGGGGSFGSGR